MDEETASMERFKNMSKEARKEVLELQKSFNKLNKKNRASYFENEEKALEKAAEAFKKYNEAKLDSDKTKFKGQFMRLTNAYLGAGYDKGKLTPEMVSAHSSLLDAAGGMYSGNGFYSENSFKELFNIMRRLNTYGFLDLKQEPTKNQKSIVDIDDIVPNEDLVNARVAKLKQTLDQLYDTVGEKGNLTKKQAQNFIQAYSELGKWLEFQGKSGDELDKFRSIYNEIGTYLSNKDIDKDFFRRIGEDTYESKLKKYKENPEKKNKKQKKATKDKIADKTTEEISQEAQDFLNQLTEEAGEDFIKTTKTQVDNQVQAINEGKKTVQQALEDFYSLYSTDEFSDKVFEGMEEELIPDELSGVFDNLTSQIEQGKLTVAEALQEYTSAYNKFKGIDSEPVVPTDDLKSQISDIESKAQKMERDVRAIFNAPISENGTSDYYSNLLEQIENVVPMVQELEDQLNGLNTSDVDNETDNRITHLYDQLQSINEVIDAQRSKIMDTIRGVDFDEQERQRKINERQADITQRIMGHPDYEKYGESSWLQQYIDAVARDEEREVDEVYSEFEQRLADAKQRFIELEEEQWSKEENQDKFKSFLRGYSPTGVDEFDQNMERFSDEFNSITGDVSSLEGAIERVKAQMSENLSIDDSEAEKHEHAAEAAEHHAEAAEKANEAESKSATKSDNDAESRAESNEREAESAEKAAEAERERVEAVREAEKETNKQKEERQEKPQEVPQPDTSGIDSLADSEEKAAESAEHLRDALTGVSDAVVSTSGDDSTIDNVIPEPEKIEETVKAINNVKHALGDMSDIYNTEGIDGLEKSLNQLSKGDLVTLINKNGLKYDSKGINKHTSKDKLVKIAKENFQRWMKEQQDLWVGLDQKSKTTSPQDNMSDESSISDVVEDLDHQEQKIDEVKQKAEEVKEKAEDTKNIVDDANNAINNIGDGKTKVKGKKNISSDKTKEESSINDPKVLKKKIGEYKKLTNDYLSYAKTIQDWKRKNDGDTSAISGTVTGFQNIKSQMESLKAEIEGSSTLADELKSMYDKINDLFEPKRLRLEGETEGNAVQDEFENAITGYDTLIEKAQRYVELTEKQRQAQESGRGLTYNQQNWMDKYNSRFQEALDRTGIFDNYSEEATEKFNELNEAILKARQSLAGSDMGKINQSLFNIGEKNLTDQGVQELENLRAEYQELYQTLFNFKNLDISDQIANKGVFDDAYKRVQNLQSKVDNLNNDRYREQANQNRVSSVDNKMAQWQLNNSRNTEAVAQVQQLRDSLNGISAAGLNDVEVAFDNIAAKAAEAHNVGKSFGDQLKQSFSGLARYLMTYTSFYQVINTIRQAVNTVKDLDTAFTEMRKVSNEPLDVLRDFSKGESFDIANQVGTTSKQVQQSTADFMRLGESFNEAKQSAKEATVLLNVSEFQDINAATEALTAMSQAYKNLDKEDIVDKLNYIGNNYAISTSELAESLQKSAGTLSVAGNSMDEAIALTVGGNRVLQDPLTVGQSLKTISLRLTGTSVADMQEAGEEIDGLITTKSKLEKTIRDLTKTKSNGYQGVSILDENGNYKSTYENLLAISEVFKEIGEEDKKYGTNRQNSLLETIA